MLGWDVEDSRLIVFTIVASGLATGCDPANLGAGARHPNITFCGALPLTEANLACITCRSPSHDSFQKCQTMSPPKNQRRRAVPLSKAATSGAR